MHNALSTDLPDDVVLSVRGVSKKFCRNLKRSMLYGVKDLAMNMLGMQQQKVTSDESCVMSDPKLITHHSSLLTPSTSLRKDEFWALQDISFDLKRGDVFGLIGLNGSGKSTLLRVLTGIYPPDAGEVFLKGRVGALIALGVGFHPHMTGRENIYLNATILGMTRHEIDASFNDIVAFAEIGSFLDAPVSTYSSGMSVRLGFAIAIHIKPDILLIDEVLSVGDFQFQRKCVEKMKELIEKGVAVVFVSHNIPAVAGFCKRGVLLHHGSMVKQGNIKEVIQEFLLTNTKNPVKSLRSLSARKSGEVNFTHVDLLDKNNKISCDFTTSDPVTVRAYFEAKITVKKVILEYNIYRDDDVLCCANASAYDNNRIDIIAGTGFYEFQIPCLELATGRYRLHLVLLDDIQVLPYANDPEVAHFTIRSQWLAGGEHRTVVVPTTIWGKIEDKGLSCGVFDSDILT